MAQALTRLANGRARFSSYMIEAARREFAWGEHDCALFVAGGVQAWTGADFAAPFRGRYSTERGAARALKRYGAGDLRSTIAAALPVLTRARGPLPGDVALVEQKSGLCAGIWLRSNIALVTEQTGFAHVGHDAAAELFQVGE